MSERLQKFLAQEGFGSRREIEGWILAGRITINGTVAKLGDRVNPGDRIHVDGKQISQTTSQRRVLAYYKPVGEVVSRHDPEGRRSIFDRLPPLQSGRWISVGRLDLNSQGLLLVTNDGLLAHRLMHPSFEMEREYAVRVLGDVDDSQLQRLREGVLLEDGEAHFDAITAIGGEGANRWYQVILREGRHREVRRLWESQGITVSRLLRTRHGPIRLRRGLRPGRWEELDTTQMQALLMAVGIPVPSSARPQPRRFNPTNQINRTKGERRQSNIKMAGRKKSGR